MRIYYNYSESNRKILEFLFYFKYLKSLIIVPNQNYLVFIIDMY